MQLEGDIFLRSFARIDVCESRYTFDGRGEGLGFSVHSSSKGITFENMENQVHVHRQNIPRVHTHRRLFT